MATPPKYSQNPVRYEAAKYVECDDKEERIRASVRGTETTADNLRVFAQKLGEAAALVKALSDSLKTAETEHPKEHQIDMGDGWVLCGRIQSG